MLFVIGYPRSGTTLARLMLDAHPSIAVAGETGLFDVAAQAGGSGTPRLTLRALLLAHDGWYNLGLTTEQLDAALTFSPFTVPQAIRRIYAAYASKHGKPSAGDKSCANWTAMDLIARVFPAARFLHIIRDPRDAIASIRQTPFAPTHNARALAADWRYAIQAARSGAAALGVPYREVFYKRLVTETETVLQNVCTWLGVVYDPVMLNYTATAKARFGEMTRARDAAGNLMSAEQLAALHANLDQPPSTASIGRYLIDLTAEDQQAAEDGAGDLLAEVEAA